MNCILHIGSGKCGSSTLQAALSQKPVFTTEDASHRYEYVCLERPEAGLLRGPRLTRIALRGPYGYASSISAEELATNADYLELLRQALARIREQGATPILSCEAWTHEHGVFMEHDLLPRLGLDVKVVLFIRPQVPWINSAWWQWGAWSGHELNHWIETTAKGSPHWMYHVRQWQRVTGVKSIEVYSTTRDVISTFFDALGATVPQVAKSNTSLNAEILRFFQRNREFRSHEHASEIDFILQRCLPSGPKDTPWVIPHAKIAELIDYYRDGNKELLSLVSESERKLIEIDPHWWDADAYRDQEVVSPEPPSPTVEEVENLTRRAIRALIGLDEQLRSVRAHVSADQPLSIA